MSYKIHGAGASRLLVMPMGEAHRWRFMQVKDGQAVRVKFTRAGKRLLAHPFQHGVTVGRVQDAGQARWRGDHMAGADTWPRARTEPSGPGRRQH